MMDRRSVWRTGPNPDASHRTERLPTAVLQQSCGGMVAVVMHDTVDCGLDTVDCKLDTVLLRSVTRDSVA